MHSSQICIYAFGYSFASCWHWYASTNLSTTFKNSQINLCYFSDKCLWRSLPVGINRRFGVLHRFTIGCWLVRRLCRTYRPYIFNDCRWHRIGTSLRNCYAYWTGRFEWRHLNRSCHDHASQFWCVHISSIFQGEPNNFASYNQPLTRLFPCRYFYWSLHLAYTTVLSSSRSFWA